MPASPWISTARGLPARVSARQRSNQSNCCRRPTKGVLALTRPTRLLPRSNSNILLTFNLSLKRACSTSVSARDCATTAQWGDSVACPAKFCFTALLPWGERCFLLYSPCFCDTRLAPVGEEVLRKP